MAKRDAQTGDKVTIKKYANRRLYNTSCSSYITLDDLAKMTREGTEFEVVDAKTGDDITHSILTQIIMDEEANGTQMLPVGFLRDLISMYGNSMQSMMPQYLEASMASFRENQAKIQEAFREGLGNNPIAKIHENNMAMMRAVGQAILPGSRSEDKAKGSSDSDEIAALRKQMEEMQKKLDEIGK
ncbi:polyhydroxyalkanoate synthesis repressor PhaR [Pontixanthobacter aquaemixtae]|uniref:Polyhydroxyalkanoate synthesis repressor PhaR n=1 Tax=Pontixanthobacter aquaemixtae TaxID=1958940 RepID=A0A844ZSZ5_9SPHN|nr:polyhydroxyalkanoate synthesis repressor PhaR [Pontixanthobacter aquaemixtae]MXO90250.1 polyhydroxyalkanoate synthesis repressor PhaR [Pontixanthobacter aquaemixtae]